MLTAILVLIYVSFISLGLPDAVLGASWPVMQTELNAPVAYAGVASFIVAICTIISSLNSVRFIRRFGTGVVTAVSVMLTAIAIVAISFAPSFWVLCLLSIPMGLGAGAVDSGLNNFVANHYKAKHMNWLHCFWGIGAMGGPIVMGMVLAAGHSWRSGYSTIGVMQIVLTIVLVCSIPLWKKVEGEASEEEKKQPPMGLGKLLALQNAKPALLAFFCYCALESGTGLWASSYMVSVRGIAAESAAGYTSLFYFGITLGRFLAGFISMKLNNKALIRLGQWLMLPGIVMMLLPLGDIGMIIALMLIGMGCAPVFPAMLHETPRRFGKALSQSIMGTQMAGAYLGGLLMPPLIGVTAGRLGFWVMPLFLALLWVMMTLASEYVGKRTGYGNE